MPKGGMIPKKNRTEGPKYGSKNIAAGLFAAMLLQWNRKVNKRSMPWKGEKDPYKIWLSEIILQQTRVEQGLKYYENFTSAFPDVHSLANASDEKILKLWEGLGYYSRCRTLIITARHITSELGGNFPKSYNDILELKGVGTYTAAAIASFAYNSPYAVLDGNVFRVLSRIMDVDIAIDSSEGKKAFSKLAQEILPQKNAAEYNQAIMDFGAVICKPVPECHRCFFKKNCVAFLSGKQDVLPIKQKKLKVKKRWLNYFVIIHQQEILIHQRTQKDIWQELFEFLLIETPTETGSDRLVRLFEKQYGIQDYRPISNSFAEQKLTHQYIHFSFSKLQLSNKTNIPGCIWVNISDIDDYTFPKTLKQFIVSQLI
ncbi:MAG: A/G-specific adenine glycosylase [Flavisolibacter sp.]